MESVCWEGFLKSVEFIKIAGINEVPSEKIALMDVLKMLVGRLFDSISH